MKKGILCTVRLADTHIPCQYNDVVVTMGTIGMHGTIILGYNFKTMNMHHYYLNELKVIYAGR